MELGEEPCMTAFGLLAGRRTAGPTKLPWVSDLVGATTESGITTYAVHSVGMILPDARVPRFGGMMGEAIARRSSHPAISKRVMAARFFARSGRFAVGVVVWLFSEAVYVLGGFGTRFEGGMATAALALAPALLAALVAAVTHRAASRSRFFMWALVAGTEVSPAVGTILGLMMGDAVLRP